MATVISYCVSLVTSKYPPLYYFFYLSEEKRQTKQKHNTIYVGHHYAQANTNNINKTWTLLQITGGKDKPNIVFFNAEIAREVIATKIIRSSSQSCSPLRNIHISNDNRSFTFYIEVFFTLRKQETDQTIRTLLAWTPSVKFQLCMTTTNAMTSLFQ
jgi:hypothetical protein